MNALGNFYLLAVYGLLHNMYKLIKDEYSQDVQHELQV